MKTRRLSNIYDRAAQVDDCPLVREIESLTNPNVVWSPGCQFTFSKHPDAVSCYPSEKECWQRRAVDAGRIYMDTGKPVPHPFDAALRYAFERNKALVLCDGENNEIRRWDP